MWAAGPVPPPPGLDECRSFLVYAGAARAVITRFKYRNDRAVLRWLADGMAGLLTPPPGAVVTWAPTATRRRRVRGFDQAELLAVAVARRWGASCVPLLVRRGGGAQTGRSRGERRANAVLASRAAPGHGGPSVALTAGDRPPVVVIDDVLTTGATLSASATALRATGVPWVGAVTAARTPAHATHGKSDVVSPRSVSDEPPVVEESLKFARFRADDER